MVHARGPGESTPDLIVLDWMLPAVSGIEICRRLHAQPATAITAHIVEALGSPRGLA
jgi:DNA-binding response OmpR family regulator